MAPLDLGTARALVQRHLTDRCRVERDVEGKHDDVLNLVSLALVAPSPDTLVIWEGPCLVRPQMVGQTVEGARVIQRGGYHVRLPHDATRILRGDRLVVTESADADLVGRALVVTAHAQGATLDVSTNLTLEDVEVAGPE